MKIAVLIKQSPDTAELPKVSADEARSGEVNATMVINPWDEGGTSTRIRFNTGTRLFHLSPPASNHVYA